MVGRTAGHYQVLEKLGEGGMGVVYKGRDTGLERLVALKFLPPESTADPARLQRFLREAKATASLNHPNIVTIYEVGTEPAGSYIAMEYVQG
jgi:serine/threonine protein kinase